MQTPRTTSLVLVLLICWFVAGMMIHPQQSLGADKIKLRLGHVVAPGNNVFDMGARKLAELIEIKSKGRIEVAVFPSGQLGQEREVIEGMPLGIVDAYVFGTALLAGVAPEIGDCDLPYLYRGKEHLDKALEGVAGQYWAKLLEPKGIKAVGWGGAGFRSCLNSKRKIEKLEDFKGIKFRIAGAPVMIALFRTLGTNAIQMAWSEVYTAMQQKVIDGLECPPNVMTASKFYEVGKFLTLDEHTYAAQVLGMAMPVFNKLPADLQKSVVEAGQEAGRYMRDLAQQLDQESVQELTAKGVVVSSPDKTQLSAAIKPVYDEHVKNRDIVSKIQTVR